MAQKKVRKKRGVIFSSNLDFQATLEALHQNEMVESIVETGTRGKEGEGKSPLGGKLQVTMKGWDPPAIIISSKGRIECWYYEDVLDVNEVLRRIPVGWAYAYPEYTAVEAIRSVLDALLIPVEGKELSLQLVSSSIPRDYFEQLRMQRYERLSSEVSDVRYICSCGRPYVYEASYKKHTEKCEQYNTSTAYIQFSGVLAKPGPVIVVGQSPFGSVTFTEIKTWEELKKATERHGDIPILLGHPKKPKW